MNNLVNRIQLIGHLGRDVDYKKIADGKTLSKVTIATKDVYYDKDGNKTIDTQWHNLVAWGKTADRMNTLLKSGKKVAVQGKLKHRSYEDTNGNKKYFSEVEVSEFMMLS